MLTNLVTGGTGFLGSHLVAALVGRGEKVRALVRPTSKVDGLRSLGVELIEGDLADAECLQSAARKVDRVYNCAGLVADWGAPEAFRAANVTGVRNLLDAVLANGVDRFVHISTSDVYGFPDYPAGEATPYRPRGFPYGDTKISGEQLVWSYHQRFGLPASVVRPVTIYGPGSLPFVMEIVKLLKSGSMIHIAGGHKCAGLAYVGNVVHLILLAADNAAGLGQAYNASDGSAVTWREYVDRLADISGAPRARISLPHRLAYAAGWSMEKSYEALSIRTRPLLTRHVVEVFGTSQAYPIDKARQKLGYEPRVDFEQGMQEVATWLRELGLIGLRPTPRR